MKTYARQVAESTVHTWSFAYILEGHRRRGPPGAPSQRVVPVVDSAALGGSPVQPGRPSGLSRRGFGSRGDFGGAGAQALVGSRRLFASGTCRGRYPGVHQYVESSEQERTRTMCVGVGEGYAGARENSKYGLTLTIAAFYTLYSASQAAVTESAQRRGQGLEDSWDDAVHQPTAYQARGCPARSRSRWGETAPSPGRCGAPRHWRCGCPPAHLRGPTLPPRCGSPGSRCSLVGRRLPKEQEEE